MDKYFPKEPISAGPLVAFESVETDDGPGHKIIYEIGPGQRRAVYIAPRVNIIDWPNVGDYIIDHPECVMWCPASEFRRHYEKVE